MFRLKIADLLQGTDIALPKLRPFMLTHAQQRGVQLRPALVALHE